MRISDWSSDVCSSDLLLAGFMVEGIEQFLGTGEARTKRLHGRAGRFDRGARLGVGHLQLERQGMVLGDPRKRHADKDRTSVGKGKSVSVRVALDGRHIIKKKYHYASHKQNVQT